MDESLPAIEGAVFGVVRRGSLELARGCGVDGPATRGEVVVALAADDFVGARRRWESGAVLVNFPRSPGEGEFSSFKRV